MSPLRAVVLVAVAGMAVAGLVAISSRAGPEVRSYRPAPEDFRASLGDRFTELQRRRSAAYRRPAYVALLGGIVVELAALLIAGRRVVGRLADALEAKELPFVLQALAVGAALAVVVFLAALPIAYVRGFVVEHAWGLSTQGHVGWLSDQVKSLGVGIVVSAVTAAAFFGIVRARPSTWWIWGWLTFSALTVLMAYVWPVVVAPVFNRFVPLEEGDLRTRIEALAAEAEVEVDAVLVADASRRTTAENAYVAGLGSTKRIVLYDTLLRTDDDEQTLFVVAHELGHEKGRHVLISVGLACLALLAGFALLALLARSSTARGLWGASGIGDLRVAPALAAVAVVAGLLTAPAGNLLSRRFESDADAFAVGLTGDPAAGIASFRRLALNNISDLDPPGALVWLAFTHPPIRERIRALSPDRSKS